MTNEKEFLNLKRQLQYFQHCIKLLPVDYLSVDATQLTLVFFSLSALDLLDHSFTPEEKQIYIETIQSYLHKDKIGYCGNIGDPFAHVTMTYSALCCLKILGVDLQSEFAFTKQILSHLKEIQLPNGSFESFIGSKESDLRFCFCVCSILQLLLPFENYKMKDFINTELLIQYILQCQSFEGGFGQEIGQEAHGGSTYCALASLSLLNALNRIDLNRVLEWLTLKQKSNGGFCGRNGKESDTCYTFWIGASIEIILKHLNSDLHFSDIIHKESLIEFLKQTQSVYGGFGKQPGDLPDLLHSYLGLSGLEILQRPTEFEPRLNIKQRIK